MPRYRQLDSLRGLAAVAVMLHHFVLAKLDTRNELPPMPRLFWLGLRLLHIFFLGQESVIFFFVLSGLVLAIAIPKRHPLLYGDYALHRICRIYLPYLFSLAVAVGACALFQSRVPPWTPWLTENWPHTPAFHEVLVHVLFLGTYKQQFNTVYWSLVVEMRISLLMPLLVYLTRRLPMRSALLMGLLVTLIDAVLQPPLQAHANDLVADWMLTLHYSIFFCYGIFIAVHGLELKRIVQQTSTRTRNALLALAVITAFYFYPPLNRFAPYGNMDFLIGIGTATIVCFAMYDDGTERALTRPKLLWLGRISYSLYLMHMTVMLVLIVLLGRHVNYLFLFAIGVVASLAVAECMVRFVEKPAQRLGRRMDRAYRVAEDVPLASSSLAAP